MIKMGLLEKFILNLYFIKQIRNMNTIMVMPQNAEQLQVIEAFLNALKIRFVQTPPTTFEDLSPEQYKIANGLKDGLLWVQKYQNGEIPENEVLTLDELLNQ
jgi:hypothetical protein